MEIERKFRLKKFPPAGLILFSSKYWQGYVFSGNGELRFRKCSNNIGYVHKLTIKDDGALCREEWEAQVPAWAFDLMIENSDGKLIEKIRYRLKTSDCAVLVMELDSYRGNLDGLLILECEFYTEEDAHKFILPEWASGALEVTNDPLYKNKNLSKLAELPAW